MIVRSHSSIFLSETILYISQVTIILDLIQNFLVRTKHSPFPCPLFTSLDDAKSKDLINPQRFAWKPLSSNKTSRHNHLENIHFLLRIQTFRTLAGSYHILSRAACLKSTTLLPRLRFIKALELLFLLGSAV